MPYKNLAFNVKKIAGVFYARPLGGVTTDDLTIYPNSIDTESSIRLLGGSSMYLTHTAGSGCFFSDAGTDYLKIQYTSPDAIIYGYINDKNIFINPSGTGKVKFGTYSAGAATDSIGYISILDSGGTARKLMVQA